MAQRYVDLTVESTRGLLPKGGTILGTRRGSPFDQPDGLEKVRAFADLVLDGLIAIGGNGTLTVSQMLYEQIGIPIVGVPKTIDNDNDGTTSPSASTPASPSPPTPSTASTPPRRSHDRVILVEVMDRHAGRIVPYSGHCGWGHGHPRARGAVRPRCRICKTDPRRQYAPVAARCRSSSWPKVL